MSSSLEIRRRFPRKEEKDMDINEGKKEKALKLREDLLKENFELYTALTWIGVISLLIVMGFVNTSSVLSILLTLMILILVTPWAISYGERKVLSKIK